MITSDVLRSRPHDVNRIIGWWGSRTLRREHLIIRMGGFREFRSLVWVRLLSSIRDKQIQCSMSTAVVWACKWETAYYKHWTRIRPEHAGRWKGVLSLALCCESRGVNDIDHIDELRFVMQKAKKCLSSRQYRMLWKRIGVFRKPQTFEQIGKADNVCSQRAAQIVYAGIRKMIRELKLDEGRSAKLLVSQLEGAEYGQVLIDELGL